MERIEYKDRKQQLAFFLSLSASISLTRLDKIDSGSCDKNLVGVSRPINKSHQRGENNTMSFASSSSSAGRHGDTTVQLQLLRHQSLIGLIGHFN